MNNNIGVDIDGVLTDEGRRENNIWHQKICEYFDLEASPRGVYNFCEAYDLSLEEVEEFMAEKGKEVFQAVPPAPKAKEVLEELKNKGFSIILVTARESKYRELTLEWLKKHDIPFDTLIHSEDKAKICRELNIELFIDDSIKNLLSIQEELDIHLLLMNMGHNQHYEGAISRVNDWEEIKSEIERLTKN